MKIAVVAAYGANQYHFETDLELAQQHLSAGDQVTLLTCTGDLLSCYVNIDHRPEQCINCICRRRRTVRALRGQVRFAPLISLADEDHRSLDAIPSSFADLDALRSYSFQSLDLGMAVLSSLVSSLRDPQPSVTKEAMKIHRLALSSAAIFLSMKRILANDDFDRVYAFNGRFATLRAVLRACQQAGVDCYLHDRGSSVDRYALFINDLPHSVDAMEARIRQAWEEAGKAVDREGVASRFFENRRHGEISNWYSFTNYQQESLFPSGWKPSQRNITVFPSSEDEFVAIGDEWRNPLYASQEEGITRIANDLRGMTGIELYIRAHPNLRGVSFESLDRVSALSGQNIHVIPPESPVSSYAMLLASDVVLSFGSTMGIEATYWGKPSILAGRCFFHSLGSTTNPKSHLALLDLLHEPPQPSDRLGALMYGYYQSTFGRRFEYFHPDSLTGGIIINRRVGPGPLCYRLLLALNSTIGAFPRRLLGRAFNRRARRNIRGR